MRQEKITVRKTARLVILGNENNPQRLWILCHGYGQLAAEFAETCRVLDNGKNLLIFPEGLHRFYSKGAYGRVGASWMTKEARLDDIQDNFNYLEEVLKMHKDRFPEAKLVLLGFSQGGASVCRWLEQSSQTIDHLVLYGATFPSDMRSGLHFGEKVNRDILFVLGNADPYISKEEKENQFELLKKSGKAVKQIDFEGAHDILPEVLLELEKHISRH